MIRLEAGVARRFKIDFHQRAFGHRALGRRATPAFKREYSEFRSLLGYEDAHTFS